MKATKKKDSEKTALGYALAIVESEVRQRQHDTNQLAGALEARDNAQRVADLANREFDRRKHALQEGSLRMDHAERLVQSYGGEDI